MHSDAYFVTGKTHHLCEDYALAGSTICKGSVCHHIMLADGCSTSPHTDVGARLVLHCLKRCVEKVFYPDESQAKTALVMAQTAAETLGLNPQCLDCTILYGSSPENSSVFSVHFAGDGGVAVRYRDGTISLYLIEYSESAPEYPNYLVDRDRYEAYRRFCAERGNLRKKTKFNMWPNGTITDYNSIPSMTMWNSVTVSKTECDIVAVFSDGINTFHGMTAAEVVRELMAFKNVKGEFVKRRMKRFLKTCDTDFDDDVSMAAIWLD